MILQTLWLVPAFPLLGSVLLVLSGGRLPQRAVAVIGVGSVALSAIITTLIGLDFMKAAPAGQVFQMTLWHWIAIGGFNPTVGTILGSAIAGDDFGRHNRRIPYPALFL